MNATVKNTANVESGNPLVQWYNKQLAYFDKHVFAMMAMYMIIQSCVGSAACMFVLMKDGNTFFMILAVAFSMASNAMFIAQAGAKIAMGTYYASIIINVLLIITHI